MNEKRLMELAKFNDECIDFASFGVTKEQLSQFRSNLIIQPQHSLISLTQRSTTLGRTYVADTQVSNITNSGQRSRSENNAGISNDHNVDTSCNDNMIMKMVEMKLKSLEQSLLTNNRNLTDNIIKTLKQELLQGNSIVGKPEIRINQHNYTQIKTKISNLYVKRIKIEHHMKTMQSPILNGTAPNSIRFFRFPKPFLWDDPIFVDEYNAFIKEMQKNLMTRIVNRCENLINSYNQELAEFKDSLKVDGSSTFSIDKFIDEIKEEATKNTKDFFERGHNKVLRALEAKTKNPFEGYVTKHTSNRKMGSAVTLPVDQFDDSYLKYGYDVSTDQSYSSADSSNDSTIGKSHVVKHKRKNFNNNK